VWGSPMIRAVIDCIVDGETAVILVGEEEIPFYYPARESNRDTSYFLTIRYKDKISPIVEVGGHRYEGSLFRFRRDY